MRQPVANVHRRDAVLLCTEVMAMGVHTPGLDIGVSLGWCGHGWSRDNAQPGVPSARWKVVQEAGRTGKDRGGKLYQREVRRKRRPESFLKLEKFLAERVMIIEDRVEATKEESREDVKVVENMETEESEAADEETDMETEESDKETEDSDMEMEDRQDGLEDTASETELEFDSDDDSD